MNISYRSKPAIKFIKEASLAEATIYDDDSAKIIDLRDHIKYEWGNNAYLFEDNIRLLTQPFIDAADKAHDKMVDAQLPEYQSGAFIYDKYTYCYAYNTYGYTTWEVVLFEFYDENLIYYHSMGPTKGSRHFISDVFRNEILDTKISDFEYIRLKNDHLFSLINFIKYAEIDIKIVKATKKIKYDKKKYVNNTKFDIEVMDTTWFTEIVRTDGFPVSGHFRFQPCGKEREERRLIWIQDFEKHGYIKRAKKLKEEPLY